MSDVEFKCLSCTSANLPVFVFDSNLAGRHGKGVALHALHCHGATYGEGWGRQGHSYAIPTKDGSLKVLSLVDIQTHVDWFRSYALLHEHETFFLTCIGCGLAGYRDEDMAPLFHSMSSNVILPEEWLEHLTRPTVVEITSVPKSIPSTGLLEDDRNIENNPELWYV